MSEEKVGEKLTSGFFIHSKTAEMLDHVYVESHWLDRVL
jgi:hypothetical protein